MDGLLPLPTGRGTEVSCPFWDRIHTSLKSIKWVTGEGTGKVSSLSAHCWAGQSRLKLLTGQGPQVMSIELLN